jgi:putative FmdB family regulatory protein
MPIYEFYCADCHRILSFLSRRIDTQGRPACPKCSGSTLHRLPSSFAISKGRKEEPAGPAMPDVDESRLERAMESLASEAEGMNEDDPRQAAHFMRRMFEAAGLPVGGGMEQALKRLEAGEDPEQVEAEMGDAFDEDPFQARQGTIAARLKRRFVPPTVDPTLYEM